MDKPIEHSAVLSIFVSYPASFGIIRVRFYYTYGSVTYLFRASPYFRWYDLWIGAYLSDAEHKLYVQLIPCFGVWFQVTRVVADNHPYRRKTDA